MSRLLTLFSLRIRHGYHPDQVCRDLRITPTTATLRLPDRHRLHLMARPDGIAVAAWTGDDGKSARVALPHGEVFGFDLSAPDPAFAACTDLQVLNALADPVFRNAAAGVPGGLALSLSDRESWAVETRVAPVKAAKLKLALAGRPLALDGDPGKRLRASDFRLLPPAASTKLSAYDAATRTITLGPVAAGQPISLRYRRLLPARPGVLAAVELRYDKALPAPGPAAPAFEIVFAARAARWAYYLLTDQAGDFSIVDAQPQGPALGFSPANRTVLDPAADETDALARTLGRQFGGLRRLRFLSDQAVPCSSATRRGIELRLGEQTVLGAMPSPSPDKLSRILPKPGAATQGQDTFYQVIRYLNAS